MQGRKLNKAVLSIPQSGKEWETRKKIDSGKGRRRKENETRWDRDEANPSNGPTHPGNDSKNLSPLICHAKEKKMFQMKQMASKKNWCGQHETVEKN